MPQFLKPLFGVGVLAVATWLASGATPTKNAQSPTFSKEVAPILYQNCTRCHRPGAVAPFSLTSYDDAKKWAKNIAEATKRRAMPPWKAEPGFGEFHDARGLTEAQIATLSSWSQGGTPQGDPNIEPALPIFKAGWPLGKPDLVLQPKGAFTLAPEGPDEWRHYVLDPKLKSLTYVRAFDIRPGNAVVVHHVVLFIDRKGEGQRLEAKQRDGQPGYRAFGFPGFTPDSSFGGWVPGSEPRFLPEGAAYELLPGDKIIMQVHYSRNGTRQIDQTSVGLYFSPTPARHKVDVAWLGFPFFRLKAGEANQRVAWRFPVRENILVYFVMPHMHLLGTSMKATVELPDGSKRPLIWIKHWDFNWQLAYPLKEPMRVPKGSFIAVEATFDNSAQSPFNPNSPPKDVYWGYQTSDEMFMLVLGYAAEY